MASRRSPSCAGRSLACSPARRHLPDAACPPLACSPPLLTARQPLPPATRPLATPLSAGHQSDVHASTGDTSTGESSAACPTARRARQPGVPDSPACPTARRGRWPPRTDVPVLAGAQRVASRSGDSCGGSRKPLHRWSRRASDEFDVDSSASLRPALLPLAVSAFRLDPPCGASRACVTTRDRVAPPTLGRPWLVLGSRWWSVSALVCPLWSVLLGLWPVACDLRPATCGACRLSAAASAAAVRPLRSVACPRSACTLPAAPPPSHPATKSVSRKCPEGLDLRLVRPIE
ncbi:hypothetical protein FHS29_004985 [Saccharothrix tamanrassetensis]|uniref:Uncharacterized protein n=1 Tax=Saccharothrix tamanrassetensis TaxID=1051531 RepID=A0A841CQP8_9PSEU|nr:hypothetical protein [Saccharothrix tamanrassetensis]